MTTHFKIILNGINRAKHGMEILKRENQIDSFLTLGMINPKQAEELFKASLLKYKSIN